MDKWTKSVFLSQCFRCISSGGVEQKNKKTCMFVSWICFFVRFFPVVFLLFLVGLLVSQKRWRTNRGAQPPNRARRSRRHDGRFVGWQLWWAPTHHQGAIVSCGVQVLETWQFLVTSGFDVFCCAWILASWFRKKKTQQVWWVKFHRAEGWMYFLVLKNDLRNLYRKVNPNLE